MRIVCDTNVSISGLLWSGKPNQVLKLAKQKEIEICITISTLKEFEKVINYPRFQTRIQTLQTTPSEIIAFYAELTTIYEEVLLDKNVVEEDPDDDIFIMAALSSRVKLIVSGDGHLLKLANYKEIQIVNTDVFLKIRKNL